MFSSSRTAAALMAIVLFLAAPHGGAAIGIQCIADQQIPSGKTLVVPIPATDAGGPARSYTVTVGHATVSGSTSVLARAAGIMAAIRTGDPHLTLGVSYTASNTDSNCVLQTGTMEFQLLREYAPITTQIIAGLTQGGFYKPRTSGGTTTPITFHRIIPGFMIQGGDPNGDGTGGPGFSFENEFSNALIFSGTAGQLAMANAGTSAYGGSNGSQFFVTLPGSYTRAALDFGYSLFGQMLRGFDTLDGIAGTPLQTGTAGVTSSPVNPVQITSATVSQNNTDAVLLLSATGVCDAVITVTASSAGASSSSQSFTAHAVADTVDDPPFLQPVPNTTAPDGSVKLDLQGTDLQLDLLRYGYQRVAPVQDSSITPEASPVFPVSLTSNTDNTIGVVVDHWNPVDSPHGFDVRVFHLGAGARPLSGSLTSIPTGRFGLLYLVPYPVAVFTAGNPRDTAASFSASVNWGDGAYLSGSNVNIVKDPTAPAGVNRFKLIAGHVYTQVGQYPLIVKIAESGGAYLTLTGTADVDLSDIGLRGVDIHHTGGALQNQCVATFYDGGSPTTPAGYSATINWGDGAISPGVVRAAANSTYQVLGSHVYRTSDNFTVSTSVSRGAYNGYSASAWATAHIAGVRAPQVYPPFPQAHLAQAWSKVYSASNTLTSGSTEIGISTEVTIINSGNKPSLSGSFAVFVEPTGSPDGQPTIFTSNQHTTFAIPPLEPGRYVTFSFASTSPIDTRLWLPAGFDPTGQEVIGVVIYSDPVGDFDASQKIVNPVNF